MIHYHGLPITPDTAAVEAIKAGHAFVSFAHPGQLGVAIDAAQSFALDNGAFSAWMSGNPVQDWSAYYAWVENVSRHAACDFAVIPDCIDGGEADNDALMREWPHGKFIGVPVWHLHESMERLERMAADYPRIALGSSGEYTAVGTARWWTRMNEVMRVLCDDEDNRYARLARAVERAAAQRMRERCAQFVRDNYQDHTVASLCDAIAALKIEGETR